MYLKLLAAVVFIGATSCAKEKNDSLFFREAISCPAPAEPDISPWSKTGTSRACKIYHGPFVAWEDGYVHVRGQYSMGRKTGVWRTFDKEGKVTNETSYPAPEPTGTDWR
jgi:hypothetical protein